jgi:hypothetical protein
MLPGSVLNFQGGSPFPSSSVPQSVMDGAMAVLHSQNWSCRQIGLIFGKDHKTVKELVLPIDSLLRGQTVSPARIYPKSKCVKSCCPFRSLRPDRRPNSMLEPSVSGTPFRWKPSIWCLTRSMSQWSPGDHQRVERRKNARRNRSRSGNWENKDWSLHIPAAASSL